MIIDHLFEILAVIVSSGITFFLTKGKYQTEVTNNELHNVSQSLAIYRDIISDLEDRVNELQNKIESLENIIHTLRGENQALKDELLRKL